MSQPPGGSAGPRSAAPLIAALVISLSGILVIGTFGVARFVAPGAAAGPVAVETPSAASPSATSSTLGPPRSGSSPSAGPSEPSTPPGNGKYNGLGLKDNRLYNIDLPGGKGSCRVEVRRARPPLKDKTLVAYLKELTSCITKALAGPLAAQGFTLTSPGIKGYRKSVTTPCGKLDAETSPAYYCAGDATIYWLLSSDEDNEAYTFARLGYLGLLAHEYGHHLQATTGMFTEYAGRWWSAKKDKDRFALSRRLELQANCFEGVFLNYVSKSIRLSGQDRGELEQWHSYTGDEDPPAGRKPDHGTSRAQIRWLERGLKASDYEDCNTWSASAGQVS